MLIILNVTFKNIIAVYGWIADVPHVCTLSLE
jgi:hypothetical protein